jgi:predicted transcriptional regulator
MMKKYLYIFFVLSLTAIAGATDYTVYVDNSISDTYSGSATPDCDW